MVRAGSPSGWVRRSDGVTPLRAGGPGIAPPPVPSPRPPRRGQAGTAPTPPLRPVSSSSETHARPVPPLTRPKLPARPVPVWPLPALSRPPRRPGSRVSRTGDHRRHPARCQHLDARRAGGRGRADAEDEGVAHGGDAGPGELGQADLRQQAPARDVAYLNRLGRQREAAEHHPAGHRGGRERRRVVRLPEHRSRCGVEGVVGRVLLRNVAGIRGVAHGQGPA